MTSAGGSLLAYFDTTITDSSYAYPLEESLTEPSELKQDPGKRERERAVIAEALRKPWARALDFGCGVGANFDMFAKAPGRTRDAVLIGLDPDPARAAAARARQPDRERLASKVMAGTVEDIRAAPAEIVFDVILACQVLGHVACADADDIIRTLVSRLAPGGRLLLAVPAAFPAARELDFARNWQGGDLFHVVRPDLPPHSPDFRTLLDQAAFDAEARTPRKGRLPVRAFALPSPGPTPLDALPAALPGPGGSLAEAAPSLTDLDTVLYSIHAYCRDRPAIGDVMVSLTARASGGEP